MNSPYNWEISDMKNKIIEICKNSKCFKMKLHEKRAFIVLTKLLDRYPNYLNIHELDKDYNDPNKAYSDLKILEGFEIFITETKAKNRSIEAKINLDDLFEFLEKYYKNNEIIINPFSKERNSISKDRQKKIYEKFNGRCNITHYKLYESRPKENLFMKSSLTPSYDHRRPIFKNGPDTDDNIQLISELANREKNKICLKCEIDDCENCALAYPERSHIIKANGQNIEDIINKIKNEDS
jgi:hypothetical protein